MGKYLTLNVLSRSFNYLNIYEKVLKISSRLNKMIILSITIYNDLYQYNSINKIICKLTVKKIISIDDINYH